MVCILSSDFLKTRITKLNDKHIFKASDSQTPQHKTSDPAHLHHWQERRRVGVSSEQGAGRRALRVVKAPRCRCRGTNPNPAQGTNVPQGAATMREREGKGSGSKENRPEGKGRPLEGSVSKPARPLCEHQWRLRAEGRGLPAPRTPSTPDAKARARTAGHHGVPAPPDQWRWGWHSKTGHVARTTDGLSFWFSKEKNRVRCEFLRHGLRAVLIRFPN